MTYRFKITPDLIALARHAVENHKWQKDPYAGEESGMGIPLSQPDKPALMIVKDQGCYLMSPFTIKGAPFEAQLHQSSGGTPPKLLVVYAEGKNPEKDEDWWDGGDDYGENLPGLATMIVNYAGAGIRGGVVHVSFTEKTIDYSIRRG